MKLNALLILLLLGSSLHAQVFYNNTPDWESSPLSHVATGLGLADINGDGYKDMVVGNGNDISIQSLVVYYNDGAGHFNTEPDWESEDIDYHGHLSCGDVDDDGDIDVAVSVYIGHSGFSEPGKVKIYYNTGAELESSPSFVSDPFYTFSCVLGDADGDGDLDLATTAGEPYSSMLDYGKIFYNEGGAFSDENTWESDIEMGSLDVAFGDLDGNGYLDLFFSCENTPNYVFLADDEGNISNSPDWVSSDTENYVNSVEIGQRINDNEITPYAVMTENDQLGGEGRVKEYVFGDFPASTEPAWSSESFGYGSGIVTGYSDVDGAHHKTLFYGGWWLPVKARLETTSGFGSVNYTSETNSVVEAIELADLNLSDLEEITWSFTNTEPHPVSVITLPHSNVEEIISVTADNKQRNIDFVTVAGEAWISLKEKLDPGQAVAITFKASYYPDMVITNWDSSKGNYVFYNTHEPTGNGSSPASKKINAYPNPFNLQLLIRFPDNNKWEGTIFNAQGSVVQQFSSKKDLRINTESWIKGIYFVQVCTENGEVFAQKLIKR